MSNWDSVKSDPVDGIEKFFKMIRSPKLQQSDEFDKCIFTFGDEYYGCTSEEPCGKTFDTCKNRPRYGGFSSKHKRPIIKYYNGDGEEIEI